MTKDEQIVSDLTYILNELKKMNYGFAMVVIKNRIKDLKKGTYFLPETTHD